MTTGAVLSAARGSAGVAQELGVERRDQLLAGHLGGAEPGQHVVGLLEPEPPRRRLERLVGRLLADPLQRHPGDLAPEPHLRRPLLAAQSERRIAALARPVTTMSSQDGCGRWPSARMIVTDWPLRSLVQSGTRWPSTLAPTQLSPIRVWIA